MQCNTNQECLTAQYPHIKFRTRQIQAGVKMPSGTEGGFFSGNYPDEETKL